MYVNISFLSFQFIARRLTEFFSNSIIKGTGRCTDYSESGVFEMENENQQIRIVQETVAGKEITFAHVMGGPAPIIYQKLG